MPTAIIHRELSRKLIGAFYEVNDYHGFGHSEQVYVNSLVILLRERNIAHEHEVPIQVHFRGHLVGQFRADLVVEQKLIVECKSALAVHPVHERQVLNYLAASRFQVGYLLNFGPKPEFRRFVMTRNGRSVDLERSSDD